MTDDRAKLNGGRTGEMTKKKILKAGMKLWPKVTSSGVGKEIEMTHASVLYHFPNDTLKDAVATYAVKKGNSKIIVQLLTEKHPAVEKLSKREKSRHIKNAI